MKYCAYHTHSTFSDGKNTMEDMVLAAIEAEMPVLGLSDHSDSPYQEYCMREAQYPEYLAEIERLQKKYAGKITLLKGIELDSNSDPAITKKLDYFLGSVHELVYEDRFYGIDHAKSIQQECIDREHGGDIHGFERDYFNTLATHIEKNKPTILGHFDVITKFGLIDEEDPEYRKMALEALERIFKVTPVMEVNTGAIYRGYRTMPYPADFILKRWKELGGEVILGADAHATQGIICAFPEAVDRIRSAGFEYVLTLWPDGFRRESIV